jgi:hypothetical protein
MGDFNKIDGIITIPTHLGEIKMLRQVPPCVKAAFEDWLELSVRRRIARLRKSLGEQEYAENMTQVGILSASGKLRWGGEAFREAIGDVAGIVQMVVLLANEAGQTDVDASRVVKIMSNPADTKVLSAAIKEVFDSDANFLSPPMEAA